MIIDLLHGTRDQLLQAGIPTPRPADITYGLHLPITLRLYWDNAGVATAYTQEELEAFVSWQFAVDVDYDFATDPAVLTSSGFAIEGNAISFVAATNTDRFIAALATAAYVDGGGELKGYVAGDTLPAIVVQFPVRLRATRTDETATPPEETQPSFVTQAQVQALLAAGCEAQYSVDGTTWVDTVGELAADAQWVRFRSRIGTSPQWWDPIPLWRGPAGAAAVTFIPSLAAGVLSWTNDGGLANPAPLDLAADTDDRVTSPAGTVVAGKIYRQGAGAWVLADPDDEVCETCELFLALGTNAAADGMAAERLVASGMWSANGGPIWLANDGGMTETKPTATTHAGRVARLVGWVRDSESYRFDGHIPGDTFEEAAS